MRPRLLTIVLLLIAGAVVNVGVAWGFSLRSLDGEAWDSFGVRQGVWWWEYRGAVITESRTTSELSHRVNAYGWPFFTLCYDTGSTRKISNGIVLDPGHVLPGRVLVVGTAANTIVYAALLWLLMFIPFALRRFIRTRRGLCPACKYPAGESSVCTECGRAVSE